MQQMKGNNPNRTTLVCVDSFEDSIPSGRMYDLYFGKAVKFHGVMQFMFHMEELLNKMNSSKDLENLQASTSSLNDGENPIDVKSIEKGKVETFSIQVVSRKNMSWQGTVCWMDGEREKQFHSELELVLLLDSVLTKEL